MEADPSIHLLTADTGFHVFDDFQQRFAGRYLNVGIAEAAMISMAGGMAAEGKQVFVYGISPFVTLRCLEQIRVDLCYPSLPVKIVGVGAGLTYGPAGMTHHTIEDLAVLCCLPNMTVVCPGDPLETAAAVEGSLRVSGPCYLRLGKSGEPVVHERGLNGFAIGRGIRLREGEGLALLATGNMLPVARDACDILEARGLRPELVSLHTVKPLDCEMLAQVCGRCKWLATIEEHSRIGGLGSQVAAYLAETGRPARLRVFALPDRYADRAGSQEYWRSRHGLTAPDIAAALLAETEAVSSV